MGAQVKNQIFSMASGDDVDLVVTVRAADRCTKVDLTNATALWVLADAQGCRPRVSKTGTITDAENGEVTVYLVPSDTDRLCGTFHHELQLQDALGKTTTAMVGKARIVADSAP